MLLQNQKNVPEIHLSQGGKTWLDSLPFVIVSENALNSLFLVLCIMDPFSVFSEADPCLSGVFTTFWVFSVGTMELFPIQQIIQNLIDRDKMISPPINATKQFEFEWRFYGLRFYLMNETRSKPTTGRQPPSLNKTSNDKTSSQTLDDL